MNTQMIEEKLWDLSMEIGKLKAENKILKSVNDSLIQALHKPFLSGKQLTCQCEVPTGRTVTSDFENQKNCCLNTIIRKVDLR
jgi:hypothetical protein